MHVVCFDALSQADLSSASFIICLISEFSRVVRSPVRSKLSGMIKSDVDFLMKLGVEGVQLLFALAPGSGRSGRSWCLFLPLCRE